MKKKFKNQKEYHKARRKYYAKQNVFNILLKEFNKEDNMWGCCACEKWFPSAPYCVERHYDNKHPEIDYRADDEKLKFKLKDWDLFEIKKILMRVKRRFNSQKVKIRSVEN